MNYTTQIDFLKQLSREDSEKWSGNVCGPACISTITGDLPDTVLHELIQADGWDEKKGWKHSILLKYMIDRGYNSHKILYRFFPTRILSLLKRKSDILLMASIDISQGSHLVIVKNGANEQLDIFDPGTLFDTGGKKIWTHTEFMKKWRKYGIIITL